MLMLSKFLYLSIYLWKKVMRHFTNSDYKLYPILQTVLVSQEHATWDTDKNATAAIRTAVTLQCEESSFRCCPSYFAYAA